jgi:tRNA(Ile)-lysidine synthase
MDAPTLPDRFLASWPPEDWRDLRLLAAVSGGPDSVALLRLLIHFQRGGQGRIIAAHFNHGLRGAESDADCDFVARLCQDLAVECTLGRGQPPTALEQKGIGLEAAVRRQRYDFLEQQAGRHAARFVVTAHTADDQAETVLFRILRGTGLSGLGGIRRTRPLGPATLIRPLLDVRRHELEAYLAGLGQPFRRDSSNEDPCFTRNRIRSELLPLLVDRYHLGTVDSLLRLAGQARRAQNVLEHHASRLLDQALVESTATTCRLNLPPMAGEDTYLLSEALLLLWDRMGWPRRDMGAAEWQRAAQFLLEPQPTPSTLTFPGSIHLTRNSTAATFYRHLS